MPFDPRQHLIQLKGNDYLPVAARLVWLNEDAPRYTIDTTILKLEEGYAVVQATVTISNAEGAALKAATALKREDKTHFPDFLEKAETGAIGRALGMLGYGTQFAPEFDELHGNLEPRVVDAPQTSQIAAPNGRVTAAAAVRSPAFGPDLETPPFDEAPFDEAPLEAHPPAPHASAATIQTNHTVRPAEYDHAAVDAGNLFSEAKQRRLMAIALALFDLRDSALTARVLEASSKILKRRVTQLGRLHWRDGNEIMGQLEESAVKRGVWRSDSPPKSAPLSARQSN